MGNEGQEPAEPAEPAPEPPPAPPARAPKRRILPIAVLAAGAMLAAYLSSKSPHEQHVSLVLGDRAPGVTGLELQYLTDDGEAARVARFTFEPGKAPRVVSHQPELADGDYRLRIDLDAREGRRTVERRVRLGGGTTQVDVASEPPLSPTPSARPPQDPP